MKKILIPLFLSLFLITPIVTAEITLNIEGGLGIKYTISTENETGNYSCTLLGNNMFEEENINFSLSGDVGTYSNITTRSFPIVFFSNVRATVQCGDKILEKKGIVIAAWFFLS